MNRVIILLGLLILLSSCRKDNDIVIYLPPVITVDPGNLADYEPIIVPISGSVDGFVTNETGDAIQGAQVKLGSETTVTNEDGHFSFLDVEMNKKGTIVQVVQSDYFEGSRRFIPSGNGVDRIRIQLLEKTFNQAIVGSTGGEVLIPGTNGKIAFPPNSIIDANGKIHVGTVQVAVKPLDPTAEIISQQMPGDLFGVDQNLEERLLNMYGMVAVELVDDNQNPLNLGATTPATITMPVPQSLLSKAPATIPIWSYNEAFGVWSEEAEASLENGAYVGNVSHFSWWSWNTSLPGVDLTATFTDQSGNSLTYLWVKLTSTNYGTSHGVINSNGEINGLVPAGETLELALYKPLHCQSAPLYSQTIGPFTDPTNLINIVANIPSSTLTVVTGDVVCNGAAVNSWVMKFETPTRTNYFYGTGSNFTHTQPICTAGLPYSLKLLNAANLQESGVYTGFTGTVNNLGTVEVCQNSLTEFLSINLDGTNYNLTYVFDSTGTSATGIHTIGQFGGSYLSVDIIFDGTTTGSYPNTLNTVYVTHFDNNTNSAIVDCDGPLSNLDITTYNSTDIIGTFSGQLINDVTGLPVLVSGTFDCDR